MGNILLVNKFIAALSQENRANMNSAQIGSKVVIEANDNLLIVGSILEFIEEDLVLKIGIKSEFAITAKSVRKIKVAKDCPIALGNCDGGEA